MGIATNLMPLTKLTNQIAEEGICSMRKVELKDKTKTGYKAVPLLKLTRLKTGAESTI